MVVLMRDDPNYLYFRARGVVFEVCGWPTVSLIAVLAAALLGSFVWCTTGDRLSLLLYLLQQVALIQSSECLPVLL